MQHICLSPAEIQEITDKVRPSAQLRELRRLRIEAQLRANNTVLVYRRDLPGQDKGNTRLEHSTLNIEALVAHVA